MAPDANSAYGAAAASDTDFRKTWDKEAYAAKAAAAEGERKADAQARYEAKLQGKKWHKPVDTSVLDATAARATRLDVSSFVGKSTLVPAGAGVGRRGKGAGFYCEHCDLTFKDNVQYIEHLNSKSHLIATGQSGEVKVATLEDVRERIELLRERKRELLAEEARMGEIDVQERIKRAGEEEEREREERRRKRNEKRRKNGGGQSGEVKVEEDQWEGRLGIIS